MTEEKEQPQTLDEKYGVIHHDRSRKSREAINYKEFEKTAEEKKQLKKAKLNHKNKMKV